MTKVIIPRNIPLVTTLGNPSITIPREGTKQDAIQFEDEGISLGTKGTVNEQYEKEKK